MRWKRSLIPVLVAGGALVALAALLSVALADPAWDGIARQKNQEAHILIGQKPRLQRLIAGDNASFTVAITNTGDIAFQDVAITGSTIPACNKNNVGPLAPGAATSYACSLTDVDEAFLHQLIVTGSSGEEIVSTHSDDAFVGVTSPQDELLIIKSPKVQAVRPGGRAAFSVTVINVSPDQDSVLTNITVTDSVVPDCNFNPGVPVNLARQESISFACYFNDVQVPNTTLATAQGTNAVSQDVQESTDVAWIELLDLATTISAQPASLPEPGDAVTFTISVNNTGSVPVSLVSLETTPYGDVMDPGNSQVDQLSNTCAPDGDAPVIPPYSSPYSCSFMAQVGGQPSEFDVFLVARGRYQRTAQQTQDVTATDDVQVLISDVPAVMEVNVSAEPPFVPAPGATVEFGVSVANMSTVDSITITGLEDTDVGDLNGRGSCTVPIANIPPGFSYQCSFEAEVTGNVGDVIVRTIVASGQSDDPVPQSLSDDGSTSVTVNDRPIQRLYLAGVASERSEEPNNTCSQAYFLKNNRQYYFLPDDVQDVFAFELVTPGSVLVTLSNFVPRAGQLVVWFGECGALQFIDRDPDTAGTKTVDLGTQPAGKYIIQVINDGPLLDNRYYGLIVEVE